MAQRPASFKNNLYSFLLGQGQPERPELVGALGVGRDGRGEEKKRTRPIAGILIVPFEQIKLVMNMHEVEVL